MNAVALALGLVTVWFWFAPPALLQPPPAPPPPPRIQTAGLRMDVYVAVLRVEAFRDSAGTLPPGLESVFEGPEDMAGLTYERLGAERFRLTGVRDTLVIVYETGDSIAALLRDAQRVIEGPRG